MVDGHRKGLLRSFKQILGKSYKPQSPSLSIEADVWKTCTTPKNRLRTLLASARAPPRCRPLISTMRGRMAMGRRWMIDAVLPHPLLAEDESTTFPNCSWMLNCQTIARRQYVRSTTSTFGLEVFKCFKERWNSESAKCFFSREDLWRGRFPLLARRADASTNTTFT